MVKYKQMFPQGGVPRVAFWSWWCSLGLNQLKTPALKYFDNQQYQKQSNGLVDKNSQIISMAHLVKPENI